MPFEGKLFRENNHIKQQGYPHPIKLLFVEQFGFNHFLDGEIFEVLDIFADIGVNGFRVFGFWPYGRGFEEEPYVRNGKRYDLNRFNEKFFNYLKEWMDYAYEKAIVIRYELFDRCGLTTDSIVSDHHPFNQLVHADRKKFSDVHDRTLVNLQKRYLDKVVGLLREYPNVIFGVMNEFKSNRQWHYEMSKHIHHLAPDHLISGSEEHSPAASDPSCDMWWTHRGTYDFDKGKSYVEADIANLRRETGNHPVLGYSTDGFGRRGMSRETPEDMRRLAVDTNSAGCQMLSFLDQKAYDYSTESRTGLRGRVSLLNTETYKAIVNEFEPTPLGSVVPPVPLPEGVFSATSYKNAKCLHPNAFRDRNGQAVFATSRNGFLFFGNYLKYPAQRLMAVFSFFIDDNTHDDAYIAILDVVKARKTVVISRLLRRTEFPEAGKHIQMTLEFTPEAGVEYETRVLYLGNAYLAVDGVYVVDPTLPLDQLPERVPLLRTNIT